MDPQQRQLLEVVYECLENGGVRNETLDGSKTGVIVASYANDYADIQARDPDDRAPGITIGIGRAILANRISHSYNLKGPSLKTTFTKLISITIDTACSGSLVAVDMACRYLSLNEVDGAIVAGVNLYMTPDHNLDRGGMKEASTSSGRCHVFDAKADGYIKAEGVNALYLKRLRDAERDGDVIRGVIRGSATGSNGRTVGIMSPDAESQADTIRRAYAVAGITDLSLTPYLECHGTGTKAGDTAESTAAGTVFGSSRPSGRPLVVGSAKSNIGHGEPAAGITGLIKAVLSMEHGIIPGTPTFVEPNPNINFDELRIRPYRHSIPWPAGSLRRASINSFGFGGTNAHVIVDAYPNSPHVVSRRDEMDDILGNLESVSAKPGNQHILVFSANDEISLKAYVDGLRKYIMQPCVKLTLPNLAFTLSERKSRLFKRGYLICNSPEAVHANELTIGTLSTSPPRVAFIFTGQGAQWPQMGLDIINRFPSAMRILDRLQRSLDQLPEPPTWKLKDELSQARSSEHMMDPEYSQPLVTALQIIILHIFEFWGLDPVAVVGHSSGEIAAAYAAGLLTAEDAMTVAFLRGKCSTSSLNDGERYGMLAVGLNVKKVTDYLHRTETKNVQIACFNGPESITLSGSKAELVLLEEQISKDGHFARLLRVNMAYHSKFMSPIGQAYSDMLRPCIQPIMPSETQLHPKMFSSVHGVVLCGNLTDADYWRENMTSPVLFKQAVKSMIDNERTNILVEIGPSGALAGPIKQIIDMRDTGPDLDITYDTAMTRGEAAADAMFHVAGKLFLRGAKVKIANVNRSHDSETSPLMVVDLPNYAWNHQNSYWYENDSSKDWRLRQFCRHDLLGNKILGIPWENPSWKNYLRLEDSPWLKDHKLGTNVVFPAAGYVAMAIEAITQKTMAMESSGKEQSLTNPSYLLRDVRFDKAFVLVEDADNKMILDLTAGFEPGRLWHHFKVSSITGNEQLVHCTGMIKITDRTLKSCDESILKPLDLATPARLWYQSMGDVGYAFGPQFQQLKLIESVSGHERCRATVALAPPAMATIQSRYAMHPANLDGCFQACAPSLWKGDRTGIDTLLIPAIIDDLAISPVPNHLQSGMAAATSYFAGPGNPNDPKNRISNLDVCDPETGGTFLTMRGLRYHRIEAEESQYAQHQYSQVVWNPDVTMPPVKPVVMHRLLGEGQNNWSSAAGCLINLVSHKTPAMRVMELALVPGLEKLSLWLDAQQPRPNARAACREYRYYTDDGSMLVRVETEYPQFKEKFTFLDEACTPSLSEPADLLIVTADTSKRLEGALVRASKSLSQSAFVLCVMHPQVKAIHNNGTNGTGSNDMVDVLSEHSFSIYSHGSIVRPNGLVTIGLAYRRQEALHGPQLTPITLPSLNVVHLDQRTEAGCKFETQLIGEYGWRIASSQVLPCDTGIQGQRNAETVVLVLELGAPVLKSPLANHWVAIQKLLVSGAQVLWLTVGSQMSVTNPDSALVHGLKRVVCAEESSIHLITLDVDDPNSLGCLQNVHRLLQQLRQEKSQSDFEFSGWDVGQDSEFVLRNDLIYIQRVLPDHIINDDIKQKNAGRNVESRNLHAFPARVRLQCERIGSIDSLVYTEVDAAESALGDNHVEVEIYAAGVNFKDLATVTGIIPENEKLLGLEGAGFVRQVGAGVTRYQPGERVLVFEKGTFANRIVATTERVHKLPDSMSFEEAASLASVYLTALYSLHDIGHVSKSSRVLIHSASGGLGIACIQICKHVGAEVFATVGTASKREFLSEKYGIPPKNIFNSRSASFAEDFMHATGQKGADIIINSLTGELLEESWRCVAEGGYLVELGKKDMLDRSSLPMQSFGRNASYCCFDMSHSHVSDSMIAGLLERLFSLLASGSLHPIQPTCVFSFADVPSALRYMRSGTQHVGKIIISDGPEAELEVKVRPAPRRFSLNPSGSYLIVGGLKGLCGVVALQLAKAGARNIVTLNRSGHEDEKSRAVLRDLAAHRCVVTSVRGDVSRYDDVARCFRAAPHPIRGVIQGSMVLRDRPFESMTIEEYEAAVQCKVNGTWNLHNACMAERSPIDFFTMMSSVSGLVGQRGQANYAAGNVFLDNFAVYRNQIGLKGVSVNLGAIEDVGYMSEHSDLLKGLDRSAWTAINERLFKEIMEVAIFQDLISLNPASRSQLVTSIMIPQPRDSRLLADRRFAGLPEGGVVTAAVVDANESPELHSLNILMERGGYGDKRALQKAVIDVISVSFARIMKITDEVELGKPPNKYGLDSLAAVEWRGWIRKNMSVDLSTLDITGAASLTALSAKIVEKLVNQSRVRMNGDKE
ncbi:Acyl transferase/acyl hydrolase/lysophospholipase [Colletotrichum asianum]